MSWPWRSSWRAHMAYDPAGIRCSQLSGKAQFATDRGLCLSGVLQLKRVARKAKLACCVPSFRG